MDMWVVYVDSNPKNVRGFFVDESAAITFQANLGIASDRVPCRVFSYTAIASTVVTLP